MDRRKFLKALTGVPLAGAATVAVTKSTIGGEHEPENGTIKRIIRNEDGEIVGVVTDVGCWGRSTH